MSRALALLRRFGDLIAPPLCPICDRLLSVEAALCAACWRRVAWIERPFCERLGTPFPFDPGGPMVSPAALADPPLFHRARAVARYDEVSGALIHALKYRDRPELAAFLGGLMANAGRDILSEADVLVPVPLHRMRLMARRFNQSALLAQAAAGRTGLALSLDALRRRRATRRQVGLNRTARRRNVADAFHVPPERRASIQGRRVVLVDDVLTSGATAEAAVRALLDAGASQVDVLVFARVAAF